MGSRNELDRLAGISAVSLKRNLHPDGSLCRDREVGPEVCADPDVLSDSEDGRFVSRWDPTRFRHLPVHQVIVDGKGAPGPGLEIRPSPKTHPGHADLRSPQAGDSGVTGNRGPFIGPNLNRIDAGCGLDLIGIGGVVLGLRVLGLRSG